MNNNVNAPACKVSNYLTNKPNACLISWSTIHYENSINVAGVLTKFKVNRYYKMLTFDTNDLCVTIPTKEILRITKSLLLKHNDARNTKQLRHYWMSFSNKITSLSQIIHTNQKQESQCVPPFLALSQRYSYGIWITHWGNSSLIQRSQHSTLDTWMTYC